VAETQRGVQMAWDVPENVVIGKFIMGLGRAIGVRYGMGHANQSAFNSSSKPPSTDVSEMF
jgi:hypothetical protein